MPAVTMSNSGSPIVPSPFQITQLTMAMQKGQTGVPPAAAPAAPYNALPITSHTGTAPVMENIGLNEIPAQSLLVEFLWTQANSNTSLNFDFICQVNFEEEGMATSGTSLDFNVPSTVPLIVTGTAVTPGSPGVPVAHPGGNFDGNYSHIVSVPIGTAAGQLRKGIYTVTALFFLKNNTSGFNTLGGFVELGKVNVF